MKSVNSVALKIAHSWLVETPYLIWKLPSLPAPRLENGDSQFFPA